MMRPEESVAMHGKFRRSIDRQSVATTLSLTWSIVVPPSPTITILMRRILKAYEGGSILYKVYVKAPGASVTYSSTPIDVISSNALVMVRRVTAWDNTGATLNDIDEIAAAGAGNNSGGSGVVEAMRVQPAGAEFIVVAKNESNGSRTVTLGLQWAEVNSVAELGEEV